MKALLLLIVGSSAFTEVFADEAVDFDSENISVTDAASFINADRGSASRPREIAAAAVGGKRLDLVDFCIEYNSNTSVALIDALELASDSTFKEKAVIRVIRSKYGWEANNSDWGSRGLFRIRELYSGMIEKHLPGVRLEQSLFATEASRAKLADDLEAAINRESGTTRQRTPKPRPKPNDAAFAGAHSASAPGKAPSAGSVQTNRAGNQTALMNYLWLAIAIVAIGAIWVFLKQLKPPFER